VRGILTAIIVLTLLFFAFITGVGFGIILSKEDALSRGPRVAVLRIEGVILDPNSYLESLSKIKKDESIKALVLRIDSPGGAVGPSQEIYREVQKISETKPVVASLGSIGASGGYYIACAAKKILANPGTITGSIGVVAQFVNYEELLRWAKIDVETVKSGEFKDVGSPFREMTEEEKKYIQGLMDNVHSQFKLAVAKGRGIELKDINKIADGRIFTGEQARDLGLIDDFGTLSDAIRIAANMGGIKEKEPDVVYYPKPKTRLIDYLLSSFIGDISSYTSLPSKGFGLFYLVDIIQ
jgi:protease-4